MVSGCRANIQAILAPDGSYLLNIKEYAADGERHFCLEDLVIAHQRQCLIIQAAPSQSRLMNGAVMVNGIRSSRATMKRTPCCILGETGKRST